MTIRSRLLFLLLPPLIVFILLIFLLFFFNWKSEITESFRAHLQSIAVTTAKLIDLSEVAWIDAHRKDPDLPNSPIYKKTLQTFQNLTETLPIESLYIVNESETLITSHRNKVADSELIKAYAPIANSHLRVGADINMELLNKLVDSEIVVLIASTLFTIALLAGALFFVAHKISAPVNQLKNAALDLAAGDYEENISVQGPKEIVELSNAFNTMRECLLDHISRLRDHSLQREHLYGEQECASLLQSRMVDGVIEKFEDPRLAIKHIKFSMKNADKAVQLSIDPQENGMKFSFVESNEEGFDGVWALLNFTNEVAGKSSAEINFKDKTIHILNQSMPTPLLFSTKQEKFLPEHSPYHFESGDYLFLFSQELLMTFHKRPSSYDWITKVMKQFSKETLDLLAAMLTSEIHFWMKKQHLPYQMHMICIKLV